METITKEMFESLPDVRLQLRKNYNLDAPGRMEEAIDLLQGWIKKQNHFVRKDFPPDYLEKAILTCKGSVEKAKKNIDLLFSLRTTMPHYYGDYDFRNFNRMFEIINMVVLPKFATDYHRIVIMKCTIQKVDRQSFLDYFRYSMSLCDYLKAHDYYNGYLVIMDHRNLNITEFIASIDLMDLQLGFNMYLDGYKARVKGIHIISSSTMIHTVVKILKQFASQKIKDRFYVHKTLEELYEVVPKDLLPVEYGGKEKSIKMLQDDWIEILSSEEHRKFMKEMNEVVTKDSIKLKEKRGDDYTGLDGIGLSGSFRTLNVD